MATMWIVLFVHGQNWFTKNVKLSGKLTYIAGENMVSKAYKISSKMQQHHKQCKSLATFEIMWGIKLSLKSNLAYCNKWQTCQNAHEVNSILTKFVNKKLFISP
jgi:hypothetical protein